MRRAHRGRCGRGCASAWRSCCTRRRTAACAGAAAIAPGCCTCGRRPSSSGWRSTMTAIAADLVLDPRAAAFRPRAPLARPPGARELRAAVSAARSDDDAGSVLQHRLSLRRDLPRRAYPGGPGRPDLAIALLQKGLAAQPQKWQYMQDLGFVYYWHLHDYKRRGEWFQSAADMPGAPSWLRPLAAVTLAEGGTSRRVPRALAAARATPRSRGSAIRRAASAQLDAMDSIESLSKRACRAYHACAPRARR